LKVAALQRPVCGALWCPRGKCLIQTSSTKIKRNFLTFCRCFLTAVTPTGSHHNKGLISRLLDVQTVGRFCRRLPNSLTSPTACIFSRGQTFICDLFDANPVWLSDAFSHFVKEGTFAFRLSGQNRNLKQVVFESLVFYS